MKNKLFPKVGAVVLARYSSSRLPGKALKEINNKKVLEYVLERLEQVISKELIVLATSSKSSDDPIAEFAKQYQVKCYRGALEDVALRFYHAAKQLGVPYVCRINGDNIFLDPGILKAMVDHAQGGQYRFLSNVKGRTYPKGMSIEIVDLGYYEELLPFVRDNTYYMEHVMVHLYEKEGEAPHFYLKNIEFPEMAGVQLALDTPEDFKRSKWLIQNMSSPHYKIGLPEITKLLEKYEK